MIHTSASNVAILMQFILYATTFIEFLFHFHIYKNNKNEDNTNTEILNKN